MIATVVQGCVAFGLIFCVCALVLRVPLIGGLFGMAPFDDDRFDYYKQDIRRFAGIFAIVGVLLLVVGAVVYYAARW